MTLDIMLSTGCLLAVLLVVMTSSTPFALASDAVDRNDDDMKPGDYKQLDQLSQLIADYLDSERSEQQTMMPREQEESDWQPAKRADILETSLSGIERRSDTRFWKSKRPCNLGIFGDQCRLSELDAAMRAKDFLSGGYSPGKRQALATPFALDQSAKSKRSCRVRLGGHCLTEALDKAARQYHFLHSADSPGRRRRSVSGPARSFGDSLKLSIVKRSLRGAVNKQNR